MTERVPQVPDESWFDPTFGTQMHTGTDAVDAVWGFQGGMVAADIETPGLDDPLTIRCVTASWWEGDTMRSVLLDPARRPEHHAAAVRLFARAETIVFHNSPYDVPALHRHGLIGRDEVFKISDTLIAARMAEPDPFVPKSLTALAERMLGLSDMKDGMRLAFRAAGYRTIDEGYAKMDIDRPIYRLGAMGDTAATLRLWPLLVDAVVTRLTDHPFEAVGITDRAGALDRLDQELRVNRIMLWRGARGLVVREDYLHEYRDRVHGEVEAARAVLEAADIRPGVGADLVAALDTAGALPDNWPRTATGRLSSAKGHLESIDHPLATAHRTVAETVKVLGYLDAVVDRGADGRVFPQCGVLAASATGRMAYASPALQQFSEDARPIIGAETPGGLTSIDWSQIEPVTLANLSGDEEFLAPFEAGADLYGPIQRAAGIDRNTAKVVLLASLYGMGTAKLAETIGQTPEGALQIKRQMFSAMPKMSAHMGQIEQVAEDTRLTITASGRVLPIPVFQGRVAVNKATNYRCQGSAYDILSYALTAIDDAGLSDHVHLAMHDELVVDAEVGPDVKRIMETPPEWLVARSGRTPVLRCDLENMGDQWKKV